MRHVWRMRHRLAIPGVMHVSVVVVGGGGNSNKSTTSNNNNDTNDN